MVLFDFEDFYCEWVEVDCVVDVGVVVDFGECDVGECVFVVFIVEVEFEFFFDFFDEY